MQTPNLIAAISKDPSTGTCVAPAAIYAFAQNKNFNLPLLTSKVEIPDCTRFLCENIHGKTLEELGVKHTKSVNLMNTFDEEAGNTTTVDVPTLLLKQGVYFWNVLCGLPKAAAAAEQDQASPRKAAPGAFNFFQPQEEAPAITAIGGGAGVSR